ncbi:MAG: hypothetical protein ACREQ7_11025 [Candidatus Binatia bacterium]
MKNLRLRLVAIAIALIAAGANSAAAWAVETAGGDTIVVKKPVNDDLIAAGQRVDIRAAINGDLIVAGADVAIEEPVDGYAMAAGRNIDVNGPVRNDLWAAGASIEVNAPIGDNAMLAGREVNLHSSAAVRGDARIAAGTAGIEAPIERNLNIVAGTAQIGSEVGGSVEARVQRLRVLPGAVIRGDLLVHGPYAPEISPEAKVLGQVRFNEIPERNQWSWLLWWLFGFAALLVLGFAAVTLSPLWANRVAAKISERPGASALIGMLSLLLVPIIAGLLLVTIIGIPLAVVLLALYVVAILLSGVFVAYLVGGWLLDRINRRGASPWMRIVVGALVVSLFMSLPWIGGIVQLIVLLIGFGALVLERRDSRHRLQPAAAVT